jgi:hypothetical protein
MADGTFEPVSIARFSGGLVTSRDAENLKADESPDLLNVDFDGQGSFQIRLGYELFGNRTNTAGNCLTAYAFRRPIIDDELALRQRGTTLEYYHSGTGNYETVPINGSLTPDLKLGYAAYTSSTDIVDYVYYCDGSIALQRWNGGHTLLNGALAGGETTVTVDSTNGFNASGSIDIGGSTVTYTGVTSTTFTGCAGVPVASDNAPIEQIADAFSASTGTKPKGNIMRVVNAQLVVAEKQFVYFSEVDDFTKWSATVTNLADSKGFSNGRVTAIGSKDDKTIVSTKDSIHALSFEFTDGTTGFQLNTEDIEVAPLFGVNTFTSLTSADGEVFYIGADNVIRRIVRSAVTSLFDTGSISENVFKGLLEKADTTECSATFFRNKLYFAFKSEGATVNDSVLIYDFKRAKENESQEAWTLYRLFVNDWFVYDSELHYVSSASPNSFRMNTSADTGEEIRTDDGGAITWYYATPQLDFGAPQLQHAIGKVVSRGFVSTEAEITYKAEYEYGTASEQEQVFSGDNETYVSVPVISALGEDEFGGDAFGDAEDTFDGFYPFTFPFDYGEYWTYNSQIIISGGTANEQYKQTKLIVYVERQADEMTL